MPGRRGLSRARAPGMAERGHGSIVSVGSGAARLPAPTGAACGASKAGAEIPGGHRPAAAEDGVRPMDIRPGLIRGPGDHGHLSMIYRSVAVTGAARYVGQGLNTYSHVHLDDMTRLFSLALDKGRPPSTPTCS